MLCKSIETLPSDDDWTFEIKFDGYRCITVKTGSEVKLYSRNRKVLNDELLKLEMLLRPHANENFDYARLLR